MKKRALFLRMSKQKRPKVPKYEQKFQESSKKWAVLELLELFLDILSSYHIQKMHRYSL